MALPLIYVSKNRKVADLVQLAKTELFDKNEPRIKFVSRDSQISKTVACAEILKKEFPDLHQQNLIYRETAKREQKASKSKHRNPCLSVLLSKNELNSQAVGYQGTETFEQIWKRHVESGSK